MIGVRTQGRLVSTFVSLRRDEPTLGWMMESRWDSKSQIVGSGPHITADVGSIGV
jgi:hypothetical protein